jgi:hypothetical protein
MNGRDCVYPKAGSLNDGIDLRTFIAIEAMKGILSHPRIVPWDHRDAEVADMAVKSADALIKKLNE